MDRRISCVLSCVLAFGLTGASARAQEKEYNFKDPKGVNSIAFVLDSVLEPIMGVASDIEGTVKFDPLKLEKTTGTITLESKSIETPNGGMTDALRGADWLDAGSYPKISFTFKQVKSSKPVGKRLFEMEVVGDLAMKDVTKEITITVTANHLPNKAGERMRGRTGDLLVLRSNFTVKRKDFNIKPDMGPETVAEDIELRVSIVGFAGVTRGA